MKNKNLFSIFLISFIQIIAISLLLKPGFYLSHDGPVQVARIGAYYKAFADHTILPRWAADLNYGYGAPVFNFYYPLTGYLGSLIHATGFSLQDSFKIIAGLAFLLAPAFFYLWIKKIFSSQVSVICALLYGLAPFHFLDLYVRGDIGELVGFVFVPLVFWSIENIKVNPTTKNVIFGSVFYALLILSHNGLSLMFTPIFIAYVFINCRKQEKLLIYYSAVLALGLGLSAFFWIPAIYDSRFVNFWFFSNNLYREHFPRLTQLIYSVWSFGPEVAKIGGLSPQIGPLHLILTVIACILYILKILNKPRVVFWLLIFGITFFLSLRISDQIWQSISLLKQLEFPWRLTAITSFSAAVLAGYVLTRINNNLTIVISILILFLLSLPMVKIDREINYPDRYYLTYPGTTTFHGEVSTVWAGSDKSEFPKIPLEVIAGDANISGFTKQNNQHLFSVHSQIASQIVDNTLYFPGWTVIVDGKSVPIEFQDPNHKGLISFSIPPGEHLVKIVFKETPVRLVADSLSLVTLMVIALELSKQSLSKLWIKRP